MADESGSADHSLEDDPEGGDGTGEALPPGNPLAFDAVEAILENPAAWEFFAAVRALQNARGNRPSVGRSTRIEQDFLRFKQEPSLSFQPTELLGFRKVCIWRGNRRR